MAKIYIDVSTPGNGKVYEFRLDNSMTVGQVKARMIEEITEFENGNITLDPEKIILCNQDTRTMLPESQTLRQSGVRSGHRLPLV